MTPLDPLARRGCVEHRGRIRDGTATGILTALRIACAFAIAGVGGVLAASLLESPLADDLWVYVGVGVMKSS